MIPIDYIVDNCTEQDYEDYMNEPVDIKAWAAETVSELALRSDYEARVLHLLARVTGLMKDLEQERRASDDRDRLAARVKELEAELKRKKDTLEIVLDTMKKTGDQRDQLLSKVKELEEDIGLLTLESVNRDMVVLGNKLLERLAAMTKRNKELISRVLYLEGECKKLNKSLALGESQ